jgi:hypothetical protein
MIVLVNKSSVEALGPVVVNAMTNRFRGRKAYRLGVIRSKSPREVCGALYSAQSSAIFQGCKTVTTWRFIADSRTNYLGGLI